MISAIAGYPITRWQIQFGVTCSWSGLWEATGR